MPNLYSSIHLTNTIAPRRANAGHAASRVVWFARIGAPLARNAPSPSAPPQQLSNAFRVPLQILSPGEIRKPMSWSRRLPTPLYLSDGRTIATLGEARDAMLTISRLEQSNPHWRLAAELLMEAAYRGRRDPIMDVGAQVTLALRADGLL
jgi:hypothetical protein